MPIEFFNHIHPNTPIPYSEGVNIFTDVNALLITLPPSHFPLLGTVQAGFPSPAQDYKMQRINLQTELIKHPDGKYMDTGCFTTSNII